MDECLKNQSKWVTPACCFCIAAHTKGLYEPTFENTKRPLCQRKSAQWRSTRTWVKVFHCAVGRKDHDRLAYELSSQMSLPKVSANFIWRRNDQPSTQGNHVIASRHANCSFYKVIHFDIPLDLSLPFSYLRARLSAAHDVTSLHTQTLTMVAWIRPMSKDSLLSRLLPRFRLPWETQPLLAWSAPKVNS